MTTRAINLVTEADLDALVLREIVRQGELSLDIARVFPLGGKSAMRQNARRYFEASRTTEAFVMLTDLDRESCPPGLVRSWIGDTAPDSRFQLRVAVREIEAWLLASGPQLATFLQISEARIPRLPDERADPKRALEQIARASRSRQMRAALSPGIGPGAIGSGYNFRMMEFVSTTWNLAEARSNSPSLERCVRALESMQA